MSTNPDARNMASRPTISERIDDEPIGSAARNATTFEVRPHELGVATGDAPRRVAVDIRLPIEVRIRTPKREWRFEMVDDADADVAYTGVVKADLMKDREPQCIPGWMPAVLAYVGFEVADSGVLRE